MVDANPNNTFLCVPMHCRAAEYLSLYLSHDTTAVRGHNKIMSVQPSKRARINGVHHSGEWNRIMISMRNFYRVNPRSGDWDMRLWVLVTGFGITDINSDIFNRQHFDAKHFETTGKFAYFLIVWNRTFSWATISRLPTLVFVFIVHIKHLTQTLDERYVKCMHCEPSARHPDDAVPARCVHRWNIVHTKRQRPPFAKPIDNDLSCVCVCALCVCIEYSHRRRMEKQQQPTTKAHIPALQNTKISMQKLSAILIGCECTLAIHYCLGTCGCCCCCFCWHDDDYAQEQLATSGWKSAFAFLTCLCARLDYVLGFISGLQANTFSFVVDVVARS